MSRSPMPRSAPSRILFVLLSLAVLSSGAIPAFAQGTCSTGSPARAVSKDLWGTLRPGDIDGQGNPAQLPNDRDSSDYTGNNLPNAQRPLYLAVDIENGWVFTSYASGFRIWNANADAEDPPMASGVDLRASGCNASGFWALTPLCTELKHFFWDIDAPAGKDDIFAMSGLNEVGLSIVDSSNKSQPRLLYQDSGKGGTPQGVQVYAASLKGRDYAFLATNQGTTGVFLYDMTAARALTTPRCAENSNNGSNCPGVYKGRVNTGVASVYLDGFQAASGKHYLAVSSGGFAGVDKGVELWDVTDPLAPVSMHSSGGRFLTNQISYGVAVWEQSGRQYLATHTQGAGQIYDITSCLPNGCSSLGNPIATMLWSAYGKAPSGADRLYVTFSRSNGRPFLYFGSNDQCSGGVQREFLFNVGNAQSPEEITPNKTISLLSSGLTSGPIDYWGWYYSGNNPFTGFSRVTPMTAKFHGPVLYRVGQTIFDTHVWTDAVPAPPTANFTVSSHPTGIYPGTAVTFTDTSTGNVTARQWTFPADATVSPSTAASVVTASFANPGPKTVTVTATNAVGSDVSDPQQVIVLDPSPAVGGISLNPTSPLTCQAVTFTANSVTGNPIPTIHWKITDTSAIPNQVYPPSGTQAGNSFVLPAQSLLAGSYKAVAQTAGGTVLKDLPFSLSNPSPMAFTGAGGAPECTNCTNGSPPFGEVNLAAKATGAAEYDWDFGDGTGFHGYSTNESQYNVANPTYSYGSEGSKVVKVRIRNCPGNEMVSQTLAITIAQVDPVVINRFEAVCAFAPCGFSTGQSINFVVDVSGNPTSYQIDWNGTGNFTAVTPTGGVVTHAYTQTGTYKPVLRVQRGSETPLMREHSPISVSPGGGGGNPQNPSITVAGPGSGKPGDELSFSATATNCSGTVTTGGWSWTATSGGTMTPSGATVKVVWSSEGQKTVTATHSACGSASGSRQVTISNGGGGNPGPTPGGLTASFTFSPASPSAGEAVSFNGGGSSGSPSTWTWSFGDNTAQVGGQQVTHTFQAPGVYTVRLEVGKQGDGPGCNLGFCTAFTTKTVTVTGGLQADLATDAQCIAQFGINQCTAETGTAVHFTANAPGASSFSWKFGDGGTATGSEVNHVWEQPGTYVVELTASDGQFTATSTRTFVVSGEVTVSRKALLLPWIAQTRGALVQSSDLYIHNPSPTAMKITLQFHRRGKPESTPPEVKRTIEPGDTLFVADVLDELFDRENIAGFVTLVVDEGTAEPVITSFNTTFQQDGSRFGQTIPGVSLSRIGSASQTGNQVQHLVGLSDTEERLAYFGLSNPSDRTISYRLRFFDKLGRQIGQPAELALGQFSQKQFQNREIREDFGVSNLDDYRVEIETMDGGQLFPYGANLRRASEDPSFVGVASSASAKVYLVGTLSSPGPKNSLWQSDVVLSNTASGVILTDMWFIPVGPNSEPTQKVKLTLQPGGTERLANVVDDRWGIDDAAGVLVLESDAPGDAFPVIQGESYDNSNPQKRFGQTIPAFTDAQAADPGEAQFLVGLRQDADYRTTYWVFNPSSTATGVYDLVYLGLDGSVLGTIQDFTVASGKARQVSPSQHPEGTEGGFTVRINVKSGKVLSAGQVVNNPTNDPAYVQGETR